MLYAVLTLGVLLITGYLASRAASPAGSNILEASLSPTTASQSRATLNDIADSPTAQELAALLQPATPSATQRATFTPEPSATPTITLTPTATPTRTLVPSLTPAVPISEDERYSLAAWTPEIADRLIKILEAYPETLSSFTRGEDDAGYYAAFDYALLAQREALLRFPSAPEAQDWVWGLAYNLARTGDPSAGATYTTLITQELNARRVQLNDLYIWGISNDPPAIIETIPLSTPQGFLSSNLVKVSAGENGSAFFWLLEKPDRFESYPLTSDFDFIHPSSVSHFVADLTGDGSAEVAIFRLRSPEPLTYVLPRIFQLNVQPPVELAYEPFAPPQVGPDFENRWEPVEAGGGTGALQFIDDVFPPCPVTVRHLFVWNGRALEFLEATYAISPDPGLLSYCSLVVEHAASVWGMETTVQIMESLLEIWPPETTIEGDPYPEDSLDEWRYRLGLYQALLGNDSQARGYARGVITNPSTPASRWIEPAQDFLEVYQTPRDIYRACLLSSLCNLRLAFQRLAGTLSAEDYARAPEILSEAGVAIRASGFFDFNNDGETERWVIVRHQLGAGLEFWILAQSESGVDALFVSEIEQDSPAISYVEPLDEPPVVKIGVQAGQDVFIVLVRQGAAQEPSVVPVTQEIVFSADVTERNLDQIQAELLAGSDPSHLQEELIILEEEPFFTCSYLLCPRYLYLLGLSSELTGDDFTAIQAYLRLWREYLGHPLASVARLKLSGPAIPPGPTVTPTRTATRVSTPIPFRTPTPTRTGTLPTPTGTLGTSTPTNTQENYP